jgi:hypothetical protein
MQGWRECLRFGPYEMAFPERRLLVAELARSSRRLSQFNLEPTIVVRDIPQSLDAYRVLVRSHSSPKRARSYQRRMELSGETQIRHYQNPYGVGLRGMLADCAAHCVRSIDMGTRALSYKAHRGGKEESMNHVIINWNPRPVGRLASRLAELGPLHRWISRRI